MTVPVKFGRRRMTPEGRMAMKPSNEDGIVIIDRCGTLRRQRFCQICQWPYRPGDNGYGGVETLCNNCLSTRRIAEFREALSAAPTINEAIDKIARSTSQERSRVQKGMSVLWKIQDVSIMDSGSRLVHYCGRIPDSRGDRPAGVWQPGKHAIYFPCPECQSIMKVPRNIFTPHQDCPTILVGPRFKGLDCRICDQCGFHMSISFERNFKKKR